MWVNETDLAKIFNAVFFCTLDHLILEQPNKSFSSSAFTFFTKTLFFSMWVNGGNELAGERLTNKTTMG